MTTLVGIGLLLLVFATLAVFVALWRWLTRPAISEETLEALWNAIAALHESVYRLEMTVVKLERMTRAGNGKPSYLRGGEER
ncbi:MAG: hypothetical protein IMHGJWDQ_000542 [Candidatus Fervidibacter sp.]